MKTLVIALTNRCPIEIRPGLWPVIARVKRAGIEISVRRRKDGATIVYATNARAPRSLPRYAGLYTGDFPLVKAGAELDPKARDGWTATAIGTVLERLCPPLLGRLRDDCIARLPPQSLDDASA